MSPPWLSFLPLRYRSVDYALWPLSVLTPCHGQPAIYVYRALGLLWLTLQPLVVPTLRLALASNLQATLRPPSPL